MPMTARQILAKTPRSRRDAAIFTRVKEAKKTKKGESILFMAKTITTKKPSGDRKTPPEPYTYVSTIEVNKKGQAIVSCSCDDFMYTWEYTLKQKGAARIEYSNGESSKDRNPQQIPGCCKHLYGFMTKLIEKDKL
jgi:hypothetical protein